MVWIRMQISYLYLLERREENTSQCNLGEFSFLWPQDTIKVILDFVEFLKLC